MLSFSKTEERDSNHSFVSIGSISSVFFSSIFCSTFFIFVSILLFEISSLLFKFKVSSASLIIFSVSGGIFSFIFFCFFSSFSSVSTVAFNIASRSPLETLSPIFTFTFSTIPPSVEGTSTLDLSLS